MPHLSKVFIFIAAALILFPIHYVQATDLADEVARHSMQKKPEKRSWNWEDAVFLYGLSEFGKNHSNLEFKNEIKDYLVRYQAHWKKKGLPQINRSDACPSALTAFTLMRDWNDDRFKSNLDPVIYYLMNEPRNSIGTLNHLGHSWLRIFYPASIWVDSLMMIGVLSSELGLSEFAYRQPKLFADRLQDQQSGLFKHAWYEKKNQAIPKTESYWLRGNGWALVSIVKILEKMPKDHPLYEPNLDILKKLAQALMQSQRTNGFWGTVINTPKSYDESSGTALVGYGLARAYHKGWLTVEAMDSARLAYQGLLTKIKKTKKGYSLVGISGPTNPGRHAHYLRVSKIPDKGYGVGPLLMLSAELKPEQGQSL